MAFSAADVERGILHLRRADPVMRTLIRQAGPFTLKVRRDRFQALVDSILSQQISGKAADAMHDKLEALAGMEGITAARMLALGPDRLREAGLSRQKASYILDISERVASGTLALHKLGRLADDDVIEQLIEIKGIGVWTAHMFLIFSLGRLDVMPHGDYGVRNAIRRLYALEELPDRAQCHRIAEPWRPYASIAAWYCWRSLEL